VLPGDEIEKVGGIPVTSVSRTILDLAGLVDRRRVERAMNEAEVQGLTGRLSLPQLLERYPRRRGSAVLRTLLREGTVAAGVTRSKLERLFVSLIETYGLPRPRLNATIAIRGRFLMVDGLWEREGLVVELDGRGSHGTARSFEADRERDRILLAAGWRVVRITWRQLKDDPEGVARDLRTMLATASTSEATPASTL
jgi:very-short-patch-repair endonuclease